MPDPVVSVVMPVHNVENFVTTAIQSIVEQTYEHWELIIVNDGSTDQTEQHILPYLKDSRIKYVSNDKRAGVSVARNLALRIAKGDFICFLDGDDYLPFNSIKNRVDYLVDNPAIEFLDGWVFTFDENLANKIRECKPTFRGNPKDEINKLSPSCLCAISWMIRKVKEKEYKFEEAMTHSEDVFFYYTIAQTGRYDFLDEEIYRIRKRACSSMTDLNGLEMGYRLLFKNFRQYPISLKRLLYLRYRITRIMVLSYLKAGQVVNSVRALFTLPFMK
ncbi:MAG TPA: glycosyltransferase family 2 protein [Cyclobacteriaceae bacterium]|nr:glycosyltransferase family 2 protein [Cyclobacteriaceae bacterium]